MKFIFQPTSYAFTLIVSISFLFMSGEQKEAPSFIVTLKHQEMLISSNKAVPWSEFHKDLEKRYGKPALIEGRNIYTIQGKRWILEPHWNEKVGIELILYPMDDL